MAQLKTNVTGFYNPNNFLINLAEANRTLGKGQFLINAAGQKVNDPYYEKFCRARALAKETGEELVDVVYMTPPVPPPAVAVDKGFAGYAGAPIRSKKFGTDEGMPMRSNHVLGGYKVNEAGTVAGLAKTTESVVPGQQNPVAGFTMEQAFKLGILRAARPMPDNFGPKDDENKIVPPETFLPVNDRPLRSVEEHVAGIIDLPEPLLEAEASKFTIEDFRSPDGKIFKKRPAFLKHLKKTYNALEISQILEHYPEEVKKI